MILADTSVWAEHYRSGDAVLARLLEQGRVVMHAAVLGELACGNLRRRAATLSDLHRLPHVDSASDAEVLHLLEAERLFGVGLSWVDLHLLAAARLADVPLYTHDRALAAAAKRLGVSALS